MKLTELTNTKKVIISCGSGGVGKTTISAMLGILAATQGKNTVVITIDPAKRLATSLGLDSLKNEPTDITHLINQSLLAEGKTPLTGKVSAIMPETEKTFERFIENVAGENKGIAKKILQTSIYKIFAQEFSGMNEYLAIEKLYDLYQSKEYDLIILDTPPSANTLMFLNAPMRLMEFLTTELLNYLLTLVIKYLHLEFEKYLKC